VPGAFHMALSVWKYARCELMLAATLVYMYIATVISSIRTFHI